jgi:hypothetical protein
MSPLTAPPVSVRDTLWRAIGLVALWLSASAALLLTAAKILSTAIKWVNA